MRTLRPTALLAVCLLGPVACDQAVDRASSEYLKYSLRQACGEDDSACIDAVNAQFDDCHANYRGQWDAYIDSTSSDEDAMLGVYLRGIYGCVVDKDGQPWFVYDPQ